MSLLNWLKQALSENDVPSMKRLGYFVALCTLSAVVLSLTCDLIKDPTQQHIANTLSDICAWLAALGGGTYVGGKMAERNQKQGDDDKPT